ncbi:MAG: tetratricopeptide repeat protein [Planctomycetaceae bacterium]
MRRCTLRWLAAARSDLDAGTATPTTGYYPRYQHALLCLALHDEAAYRADCAAMLRQFHDSRNHYELHFTAWTCALAPNAIADIEEAISLARRAVEIAGANQRMQAWQGLGAALFRAGRFDEALAALERCESAEATDNTAPAYAWYFRAMTCFKLGQLDEARRWYDKAVDSTEQILGDGKATGAEPGGWNRRLTLELLRDEAAALLGVTANRDREADARPAPVPRPEETDRP